MFAVVVRSDLVQFYLRGVFVRLDYVVQVVILLAGQVLETSVRRWKVAGIESCASVVNSICILNMGIWGYTMNRL